MHILCTGLKWLVCIFVKIHIVTIIIIITIMWTTLRWRGIYYIKWYVINFPSKYVFRLTYRTWRVGVAMCVAGIYNIWFAYTLELGILLCLSRMCSIYIYVYIYIYVRKIMVADTWSIGIAIRHRQPNNIDKT